MIKIWGSLIYLRLSNSPIQLHDITFDNNNRHWEILQSRMMHYTILNFITVVYVMNLSQDSWLNQPYVLFPTGTLECQDKVKKNVLQLPLLLLIPLRD